MPANISYDEVAKEVMIHVMGAPREMVIREARSAIIRICREMHILQENLESEWTDNGVYNLPHEGYAFDQILGVWFDEKIQANRLDGDRYQEIKISVQSTQMQLNGFGLRSPDPRDRTFTQRPGVVLINYSVAPSEASEDFPALIWEQFRTLVLSAALAEMGTYLRQDNHGRQPDYEAKYQMELKRVRPRLSAMPGPEDIPAWMGGYEDFHGTSQNSGGSDW